MKESKYFKRALLVLRILPHVAKSDCFALKGGTAINFFIRDLPRLSVDIDLAYLPLEPREEALNQISNELKKIKLRIEKAIPSCRVESNTTESQVSKLIINESSMGQVKIEPNTVFRGSVFHSENRSVVEAVENLFEESVKIKTLSLADLYGSKLCAALDRQHPRDLFDVVELLKNEGITDQIRKAFLVYLAGHNRPPHELLAPNQKDIAQEYESNFKGMTEINVPREELIQCRDDLPTQIIAKLTDKEKEFLISITEDRPIWSSLDIEGIENLPALQWKLLNIKKMQDQKRKDQIKHLKNILK